MKANECVSWRVPHSNESMREDVGRKDTVVERSFDLRSQDLEFEPVQHLDLAGNERHGRRKIQKSSRSVEARAGRLGVAFAQIDQARAQAG